MRIIIITLVALVSVAALFVVGLYNKLVALRNRFKNAYAQIDVQLTGTENSSMATPPPMTADRD